MIAPELNITKKPFERDLNEANTNITSLYLCHTGKFKKHLLERVYIWKSLVNRNKINPFLKAVVIVYVRLSEGKSRLAVERKYVPSE